MSSTYEVRLDAFEGSLDLLLHLVRSAKMEIGRIRLAEITDQYLEFMSQVDEVDMERASDFLETASILILIKSRSLLPVPVAETDGEEPDPEAELLERMRLYEVFRQAAEPLRRRQQAGAEYFYKLPEDLFTDEAEKRLLDADAEMLRAAYAAMMRRRRETPEAAPVHHVAPETYSVARQKERLLLRLERGPFSFGSLFTPGSPRLEIVVTFMALLELWGAGLLRLEQSRPYTAIEVRAGNRS